MLSDINAYEVDTIVWFLRSISSNYVEAFPYLKSFLEKVGRRKFIHPLYQALYKNKKTQQKALIWFDEFQKNYHAVSRNSIAESLQIQN